VNLPFCSGRQLHDSHQPADPRDRVFALFGLFADPASNGLVADYNLMLPEVLTGYAAFNLESDFPFGLPRPCFETI
jgi:hypothetical protein